VTIGRQTVHGPHSHSFAQCFLAWSGPLDGLEILMLRTSILVTFATLQPYVRASGGDIAKPRTSRPPPRRSRWQVGLHNAAARASARRFLDRRQG
jgi:hypothetical protein